MYTINKNLPIIAAVPIQQIVAGTGGGGSGIGVSLGKEWLAEQLSIPVEAGHDFTLLAYVGKHSWCILAAYAGDAE